MINNGVGDKNMSKQLEWRSFIDQYCHAKPNVIIRGSAGIIPGPG